jgi:drug/metabolite transporter (DMT)-like permease
MSGADMLRIAFMTAVAMLAFAANSVLARLALSDGAIDALGYTGIRLAAGALMLFAILRYRSRGESRTIDGSWLGAAALFCYAITFSVAYLMLGAGTGALILFASVQIGMLARAVAVGERPGGLEWAGFAIAVAALAFLMSPGLTAPDPLGAALMIASGLSWAGYSLLGRGSRSPLADTAGNFIRCAPVALPLAVIGLAIVTPTTAGIAYAIASGALASGLGYAIWYAVLPAITRTGAAFVQLTVPALAAAGGVVFIAEPLTQRLVLSSMGVMGGVAIALLAAERRRRKMRAA